PTRQTASRPWKRPPNQPMWKLRPLAAPGIGPLLHLTPLQDARPHPASPSKLSAPRPPLLRSSRRTRFPVMTAPQDPRLARNPLSRSPRKNTEASSASRPARFRRVRGVLLFAAVLLASLPAMAAPTDAEKETARSLMADGDRLRDSQDYQSALQRYQAAHQIMNVPTTGIEVAKTFALLGKLVEARRAAIEVANLPVTPGEPSVMAEARQEANTLAANLATRIPGAVIQVWPREANARVLVDGVEIPPAAQGLPYKTNPGDHVV